MIVNEYRILVKIDWEKSIKEAIKKRRIKLTEILNTIKILSAVKGNATVVRMPLNAGPVIKICLHCLRDTGYW